MAAPLSKTRTLSWLLLPWLNWMEFPTATPPNTLLPANDEPIVMLLVTAPPKVPSKPRDTGPKRWKDRKKMQYCMSLIHSEGNQRFSEAQIHNSKRRQTEYYAEGDDFDGGQLVYVHQTGALVRRGEKYFVYPIGASLDDDIGLDEQAVTVATSSTSVMNPRNLLTGISFVSDRNLP